MAHRRGANDMNEDMDTDHMDEPDRIPAHLPRKLTISFWLWQYFHAAQEGDFLCDLPAAFVQLKERGFNTIRVDTGIGLCFGPDGKPRGEIALRAPFGAYGSIIRQFNGKGGRIDVRKKLIELFELAQEHDVYVILSSWLYLHTFWFMDNRLQDEIHSRSPERQLMAMAEEHSRLIDCLKERGLHKQIAFVEVTNESDGVFHLGVRNEAIPGSATEQQAAFQQSHENALAFLRDRHPDLLFACDTCSSKTDVDLMPGNMQLWNHHLYYMWDLYFQSFEANIMKPDFAYEDPRNDPLIRRFMKEYPVSIEELRRSTGDNAMLPQDWYRRVWLYTNVDPAKLAELDAWYTELLDQNMEAYKQGAARGVQRAMDLRDRHFPETPLVLGEAVSYCTHRGLQWEERSETYWKLLAHTTRLVRDAGYWGYMPRTHSGPDDPAWTTCADRFREVNGLFMG